jgi:hypothetical protein
MKQILISFASVAGFLALGFAIAWTPSRWDNAVAVRICRDGTPILRLADGSLWARRSSALAYRVEDQDRICE